MTVATPPARKSATERLTLWDIIGHEIAMIIMMFIVLPEYRHLPRR